MARSGHAEDKGSLTGEDTDWKGGKKDCHRGGPLKCLPPQKQRNRAGPGGSVSQGRDADSQVLEHAWMLLGTPSEGRFTLQERSLRRFSLGEKGQRMG